MRNGVTEGEMIVGREEAEVGGGGGTQEVGVGVR